MLNLIMEIRNEDVRGRARRPACAQGDVRDILSISVRLHECSALNTKQ